VGSVADDVKETDDWTVAGLFMGEEAEPRKPNKNHGVHATIAGRKARRKPLKDRRIVDVFSGLGSQKAKEASPLPTKAGKKKTDRTSQKKQHQSWQQNEGWVPPLTTKYVNAHHELLSQVSEAFKTYDELHGDF